MAYLQINADWWYYCFCGGSDPDMIIDKDTGITPRDMSSSNLDLVTEVRAIAKELGIFKQVYEEAYKIYDFRNSGKEDFVADKKLIEKLKREFCEPRKRRRPLF